MPAVYNVHTHGVTTPLKYAGSTAISVFLASGSRVVQEIQFPDPPPCLEGVLLEGCGTEPWDPCWGA